METVTIVLALLFAVLMSDWITRFVPIPLPIVQIVLGVVLAVTPLPSVGLDAEIFFLVFLPPLLFLDGWRIPKRDVRRDGNTIIALALGLVLFTVVGIGFFIHWLVPSMPLAVSFALAAVLSPPIPSPFRRWRPGCAFQPGSCTFWKARLCSTTPPASSACALPSPPP